MSTTSYILLVWFSTFAFWRDYFSLSSRELDFLACFILPSASLWLAFLRNAPGRNSRNPYCWKSRSEEEIFPGFSGLRSKAQPEKPGLKQEGPRVTNSTERDRQIGGREQYSPWDRCLRSWTCSPLQLFERAFFMTRSALRRVKCLTKALEFHGVKLQASI
jgi:hypothetical protein